MSKTPMLGKSIATAEQMANYVLSVNASPKIEIPILSLAKLFLLAGEIEGVRGDLEFARSCHETGNFAFKGTVTPDQKNFCGHGTVSATIKGSYFPDEFYSALVQCQHAKAYATTEPLNYQCLDDRYKWVALGSAPNMEDMGGKWAVPGYATGKYSSLEEAKNANDSYGDKIIKIMDSILAMPKDIVEAPKKDEEEVTNAKPLAGKKICLDAGHVGDNYNKCPAIPAYAESAVMWKLHLMLKSELEELGAIVILTRLNQSVDKALKERGMTAEDCDLFISLHSNAVANGMNEAVDYVAVYHLTEDTSTTCDDASKEVAQILAPIIARTMGTTQGYRILTRKSSYDLNNDGVFNDNYYGVLNGARLVDVPGLILEHSFHTNTRTVNWLLNANNLANLAKAEANGIVTYFSKERVADECPYFIRVANVSAGDVLNIRKEPNTKATITGKLAYNDPNRYTIVEVQNGWGRLKSGIGWICLDYTVVV